jgi:phosphoglycerol transferase MdoB-like AlkP superfamily enzyme
MFMHRVVLILALSFAFAPRTAQAFFDPPWITPAAPRAGEIVSVNIRMGVCDAIAFNPIYPQVTQNSNAIRVIEYGDHVTFQDFCIFDIGTAVDPIGAFPPGDYTVTVDFLYDDFLYGPTIVNLGIIPFTVSGETTAQPVPTSSPPTLFALLLFVFGLALYALRGRRQNPC